jgi:hypothetical protein
VVGFDFLGVREIFVPACPLCRNETSLQIFPMEAFGDTVAIHDPGEDAIADPFFCVEVLCGKSPHTGGVDDQLETLAARQTVSEMVFSMSLNKRKSQSEDFNYQTARTRPKPPSTPPPPQDSQKALPQL